MDRDIDNLFKILVVGNTSVGKSSLFLQYTQNSFLETTYSTIGVDFRSKLIEIDDRFIKLQIWDTGSQQRFRNITRTYYRGAHGVLLVFDLTDEQSFIDIKKWMEQVQMYAPQKISKVLIGNKADLVQQRKVDKNEIVNFAKANKMQYLQTSAKQNTNVELTFQILTYSILGQSRVTISIYQQLRLQLENKTIKGSCC